MSASLLLPETAHLPANLYAPAYDTARYYSHLTIKEAAMKLDGDLMIISNGT